MFARRKCDGGRVEGARLTRRKFGFVRVAAVWTEKLTKRSKAIVAIVR